MKVSSGSKGFTLIEVVLVVAIIIAFAVIFIVAVNPFKQLADFRNSSRQSDVRNLLEAVHQQAVDNGGRFLPEITAQWQMIGTAKSGCDKVCGASSTAQTLLNDVPAGQFDAAGSYASAVMDSGAATTTWQSLSWVPLRPFGKALPNAKVSETAYSAGNADMSGNVLLLHLDETSGTAITDGSGATAGGTASGGTLYTLNQTGVFGAAIKFNNTSATTLGRISFANNANLNLGNAGTVCAWVNLSASPLTNGGIINKGSAAANTEYTLRTTGGTRPYFTVVDSSGALHSVQSAVVMAAGSWYHVCATYSTSDAIRIYVNGTLQGSLAWNASWVPRQSTGSLQVGSMYIAGTVNGLKGLLDEAVIYKRALAAAEISDLYQRGTKQLKLQVRSCQMADCSDGAYFGPSGAASYYTDNATNQLPSFGLNTSGRYFQYRLSSTMISSAVSAAIATVSAGNQHSSDKLPEKCLDLGQKLAPAYLIALPYDPIYGSDENTYYAISKSADNRISVRACGAEYGTIIEQKK